MRREVKYERDNPVLCRSIAYSPVRKFLLQPASDSVANNAHNIVAAISEQVLNRILLLARAVAGEDRAFFGLTEAVRGIMCICVSKNLNF